MKPRKLIWLVFPAIFIVTSFDIVRRHDKSDRDYLDLGAQFTSVCKVGERGGDGTLIHPRWVLTAAHVAQGMYNRQGENLKVYFEGETKGYNVDEVFIHPNFRPMDGADIALLLLNEEVRSIEPSELFKKENEQGKEIIIVGHGDARTGKGGEWIADGRRRAATNIIDEVTADKIIFDFDEPTDATRLEGTAGPGDSGGPAYIIVNDRPQIAGISSAGMPGKNGPGTYGAKEFYTRVSAYLDWIDVTVKSPSTAKALSVESRKRKDSGQRRVVTGRPDGGPVQGLGLFLMQEGDKIRIGGKADPRVPKEFRHVMFKPPSYLMTFNEKQYSLLDKFKSDFQRLKSGDEFSIQFMVKGEQMSFRAKKM